MKISVSKPLIKVNWDMVTPENYENEICWLLAKDVEPMNSQKYIIFLSWSGPHYAFEYFLFFPSFLSFIKFFGVFQLMFANIINV